MAKYKLGPKSSFFYDPTNQKKLLPGKEVEFELKDLQSYRTKAAISSGHIVKVNKVEKPEEDKGLKDEQPLLEKFKSLRVELGDDKLIKAFKRDELAAIAEELGFEVEGEDTKSVLFDIITEELDEAENKTE